MNTTTTTTGTGPPDPISPPWTGEGARAGRGAAGLPVVLVVDDVPDNLLALEAMLRRADIEIVTARSGRDALEILLERDVAVAIIDVMMPEMDGFELAELIRGVERTRRVPIIFVTAGSNAEYRVFTGYETGAIDFLFKPLDERVLRAKVDVLVALERQRREAERARAETEVLLRFAQATSHLEEPAEIYAPALDAVRDLLGAKRSAILLFDDSDRMRFRAWRGLSESCRVAVDGCSSRSRVEKDARPVMIPDVGKDETMAAYRSVFAAEGIRALGCVPIFSQRLLGRFLLCWAEPRTFSDHDEAIALTIASLVAEALERVRLRGVERRGHRHVARLQQVTASLNEVLTPDRVARAALSTICEGIGASAGMVHLLAPDGATLDAVHTIGASQELVELVRRIPPGGSMPTAEAVRTRAPVFLESRDAYLERDPEHVPATGLHGSRASIPMLIGNRVIGVVGVSLPSWEPFSEDDRAFLVAAASQCAQAFDRARLHDAERTARSLAEAEEARMAFLAEVSAELSRSLDGGLTLRKVAELAVPRISDWCVVDLVDEQSGGARRVAVVHADATKAGLAAELSRHQARGGQAPCRMARVLRTGVPDLMAEVSDEMLAEGASSDEEVRTLRAIGIRSAMIAPIAAGGRTFGAIGFVAAESGRRHGEADLRMAVELGRRAGLAFQNARLYEEERRARSEAQLAEERRASIQLISDAALAHLEIDPLMTELLARLRRIFACDTATILLLNGARTHVEVRACDGIEREAWDQLAVPYGAGVEGAIAAEQRAMVVDDIAGASGVSPVLRSRLRSMAGVPLILDRGATGVLHIGTFQPRKFTDADVELLRMVGARAAMALDRGDAYEALRLAEEKLRVALSACRMGVWEWSIPTGRVTWSPTLEAIHGLGPGTFPGTFEAFQRGVHPDDKEGFLRAVQETLAAERDRHVEYRIVLPDGRVRWVAGHGNVVARADGKPSTMMGVCLDITEQKQLQEAREAAVAELTQTLRDNEMFAGVLAHDLRNPLGAMLTATQLVLHRHREGADTVLDPLRRVISSGERMARMIEQLLDFTRARVGGGFEVHPREADLSKICGQVLGELELAHPEWRVKVEALGDFGGTWDPDRLLQLVSNLVTNAGQHGSSGSEIRVMLDGTDRGSVSLDVHNEGAIPEALLPNIFAPFRGTRERSSGSGLGLGVYIMREIVRSHGGTVEVTSSEAEGTTFRVTLPRRTPARAATS